MVSLLGGLSAVNLAARLQNYLAKAGSPSQRTFATAIGIPRSTLQDFLRDPSTRRAATIARITGALESRAAQNLTNMPRTTRVDAPVFTRESLRALSRPTNAQGQDAVGFRFVTEDDRYSSGFSSTISNLNPNDTPADALGMVGDDPSAIVSIVWIFR